MVGNPHVMGQLGNKSPNLQAGPNSTVNMNTLGVNMPMSMVPNNNNNNNNGTNNSMNMQGKYSSFYQMSTI